MAELNGFHSANRLGKLAASDDLKKAGLSDPVVQQVASLVDLLDDICTRLDRIEKNAPAPSAVRSAVIDPECSIQKLSPNIAQSAKKGFPQ